MPFLTNASPNLATFTGNESFPLDSNLAGGSLPSQETLSLAQLSTTLDCLLNNADKVPVAGTIYYTQMTIGGTYTPTPRGSSQSIESYQLTGLNVHVGTTGGTDTWHVGVWNSAGVLQARSATAGVTAGTAQSIQQIPFAGSSGTGTGTLAPVTVQSGTYYVGLQSSGNTAVFKAINSSIWPTPTGSLTGTAGTLTTITTFATTYTTSLGVRASLY